MGFDDMFADGETEAAAGDIDAAAFFGAVEALEYAGEVFFADADAIVTDLDQDMFVVGLVHAGRDTAIAFAVLDGVLH